MRGEVGDGFRKYEEWLNEVAREEKHYQEIYQECVIPSHCWIIHKDDFDAVDAFNPEIYPEDYDLCFRFYKAGLKVLTYVKGLEEIMIRAAADCGIQTERNPANLIFFDNCFC